MMKTKSDPRKLVGRQRQQPKANAPPPDTVTNDQKPKPEVVSDWEGEGGRLDPSKERPESDSPARAT